MARLRLRTRRELVFLALAVMDACIITPLIAAWLSPIVPLRPGDVLGGCLAALLLVHYLARSTLALQVPRGVRLGILWAGMLLSGLIVTHRLLHSQTRFFNPAWLADLLDGVRQANLEWVDLSQDVIVFLIVVVLWWRGVTLAQRRINSESVAFRFRLGVVALSVTTVVGSVVLGWPFYGYVFTFFFAGLLGIALARAEEVGERYGGSPASFGVGWLSTLVIAGLLVLALSAGVAALLTGENVRQLAGPVWVVVRAVFVGVTYGLGMLLYAVVALLRLLIGEIGLEKLRDEMPQPSRPAATLPAPGNGLFSAAQLASIRTAGVIVGLLLLMLVVALSLRWLQKRADQRRGDERESVWEGADFRLGLQDLLARGRRYLGQTGDAVRGSRLGLLFAAMTIRRVYAHAAALAGERGYARALHQTPYEYLPTLRQAFAGRDEEVAQITGAYVAVHYGEVPEDPAGVAAVQAAWERLRRTSSSSVSASKRLPA